MASYLATIDIGEWDVREWTTTSDLPVDDAVDPDLVADPDYGPATGPARRAVHGSAEARARPGRVPGGAATWRRAPGS
ncbi:hypothetical protein [Intrasporangium sp. DVR]|uniref:hypothetical protein n=1 Tax=Intrasporangium sp. DVR TaxID=3127867 RepID=UPI00313A5FB8